MRPFHGMPSRERIRQGLISLDEIERQRSAREARLVAAGIAAPILLLAALAWWLS
jgi:type II secretory pathway component PulM